MGSAELSSEHPIGQAVLQYVRNTNNISDLAQPKDTQIHVGEGISCTFDNGLVVHVGNQKLMERKTSGILPSHTTEISFLLTEGKTVIHVAIGNQFVATLAVSDVVKPEAAALISELHDAGFELWMVTGDHVTTAIILAEKIGIKNIEAGVLPADKAKKIEELQRQGKHVIMVGDGINDAIALAQADVSGILLFS